VLGELDKALTTYSALEGFDESDLRGALHSIQEEVRKLPQRHAELLDLFKPVRNKKDEEEYEKLLADDKLREEFYERLATYAKTLAIAFSSVDFVANTPEVRQQAYKGDLKRFRNLMAAVKLRYAEAVDYRDYEPKIRKLLDTHIDANEVLRLNEPVNIFDEKAFNQVVEEQGARGKGAQADLIAHATKRAISERLQQDPAFYEKFSKLIQQAIDDYRAKRISDLEYLRRAREIRESVVSRRMDDVPATLRGRADAVAMYGVLKPFLTAHIAGNADEPEVAAKAASDLWSIITRNRKVGFWDDVDAQRRTKNDIDDYLYDELKGKQGIALTAAEMDEIIHRAMELARHRIAV
jgi:type I restriction enzyme R subunit